MSEPTYKCSCRKIKCYHRKIYVDTIATYQYISEKNVYRLIKRTCSLNEDYNNRHRCSGRTKLYEDCDIINPPPIELPADSSEFDPRFHLID